MIHPSEVIADANTILEASHLVAGEISSLSETEHAIITALCRRFNNELAMINPAIVHGYKHPTKEECVEHAKLVKLPESEGARFWDYYNSNGWKVGKNPMKSWKSAMNNWKRVWDERHPKTSGLGYAV